MDKSQSTLFDVLMVAYTCVMETHTKVQNHHSAKLLNSSPQFLVIMNRMAMSILKCGFFMDTFSLLGIGLEQLCHRVCVHLVLKGTARAVPKGVVYSFNMLNNVERTSSLHCCQHLVLSAFNFLYPGILLQLKFSSP